MTDTTIGPARASANLAIEPGDLIRHFVVVGVLGPAGRGRRPRRRRSRDAYRRAEPLDHEAIKAEAGLNLGMMMAQTGEDGEVEYLREGVRLGLRSQNYEAAATGWGLLIHRLGVVRNRPDDGYAAADAAIALLEGIPGGEATTQKRSRS